jgi:ornithine cyclodeaminase/alanine dehydrogenase-like protein (mu-crystallin family)
MRSDFVSQRSWKVLPTHFEFVALGALAMARPMRLAGIKVVGDFVANHEIGLPSEIRMLTLFDPGTGAPVAILNAEAAPRR